MKIGQADNTLNYDEGDLLSDFWSFVMARKAASWPSIEAIVVRSDIVPTPEDESIGAKFEITYQYSINQVAY